MWWRAPLPWSRCTLCLAVPSYRRRTSKVVAVRSYDPSAGDPRLLCTPNLVAPSTSGTSPVPSTTPSTDRGPLPPTQRDASTLHFYNERAHAEIPCAAASAS